METFFKFKITQTTGDLLREIKSNHEKKWNIKIDENNTFILHEIFRPENFSKVVAGNGKMHITTVRGYTYTIQDITPKGAIVCFNGPLNALLKQSLIPRMTYVPKTLTAKDDYLEDYVIIDKYLQARAKRHNDGANPQDQFGWRINQKFNNELTPWLPPYTGRNKCCASKKSNKKIKIWML